MQLATWDGGLALLIVRTHREKLRELHSRESPRGLSERYPGGYWPLDPGKAAVLRTGGHMSCRHGAWAKGTFGNTDASGGHSSSRPHRTTVTPSGKQARTQKEPSEGRCWKGRSKWHLSSVPLAGVPANRMPDKHPKVWKGTASLGKFIVYPVHAIPSSS
ncbi:Calcium Uptake Protein 3 [Manis pentadactyla]|nr:Calcium Uptake Protein 3 [Manis pentadactyla]